MSRIVASAFITGLLLSAGIAAAQELPLTRPQWTRTFATQQRSYEQALATLHGSWLQLGDGSYLIGSTGLPADGSLRLRALEADGYERSSRQLQTPGEGSMHLQLAASPDGGAYLLAGRNSSWAPPLLERLDRSGTRLWQLTLPEGGAEGSGHPRQLIAQADGGALVVQQRMFSRIAADGSTHWALRNGDDHQYLLRNGGAVQGMDGNLWLAGSGGSRSDPDGARVAAVRRVDGEGRLITLHTFLCASCSESSATAIDVLPDGEVVVVGRSGDNEPGFIAFYRSNGAPRLRVDTPPGVGYDRLAHDADGIIYAYSERDERIAALNRDGSVRWQRDGGDMSALAHGVLISRRFPRRAGALQVDAVDADGQLRWSQQVEASDGLRVGGAVVAADGRIGLLAQINRSDDGCGIAPRVITLDPGGTPLGSLRGCTLGNRPTIRGFSAAVGHGATVALNDRSVHLTADAQLLRLHPDCPLCISNDRSPLRAQLNPDGSLWLVQTRATTQFGVQAQRFITRIAADGSVLADIEIPADATYDFRSRLLADTSRAIELSHHPAGLRWSRVLATDTQALSRTIALSGDFDTVEISNSRLWPDGSSSIALWRANTRGCQTSPPSPVACTRRRYTVLRLHADGSERWRAELGENWAFNGFSDDGSTISFATQWPSGAVQFRRIASDGSMGTVTDFNGLSSDFSVGGSGPVQGRYLVALNHTLFLVDSQGQVLTSRPVDNSAFGSAFAHGSAGFLVSSTSNDSTLLSADDLSVRAYFDIDGLPDPPGGGLPLWQLLDDGSVYASTFTRREPNSLATVARFAVPGTVAADRVFLDHFD